jgi:hypothetical protein
VILTDTDHLWGIGGNQAWVWKSFLRGMTPLFMDPYDGVVLGNRFDPRWDPIRQSLGYTLRLAESINLAAMTPQNQLSSTNYCLANAAPDGEYLVYLPEGGKATVDLTATPGKVDVEWLNPSTGKSKPAGTVEGKSRREFTAPFEGDAVLSLKAKAS